MNANEELRKKRIILFRIVLTAVAAVMGLFAICQKIDLRTPVYDSGAYWQLGRSFFGRMISFRY